MKGNVMHTITLGSHAYRRLVHRWNELCAKRDAGRLTQAETTELWQVSEKLEASELAHSQAQEARRG